MSTNQKCENKYNESCLQNINILFIHFLNLLGCFFVFLLLLLKVILNKEDLSKIQFADSSKTVSDQIALSIGTIGENMSLRRAIIFNRGENQHISWYMHGSGECYGEKKNMKIDFFLLKCLCYFNSF